MTLLLAILSTISTLAAAGALVFAWLTVKEGRAARAEEAYERELDRLYHLLELISDIAATASVGEWTDRLGAAQLRLDSVLAGRPALEACDELTQADAEDVFNVYLHAREELDSMIRKHLDHLPHKAT